MLQGAKLVWTDRIYINALSEGANEGANGKNVRQCNIFCRPGCGNERQHGTSAVSDARVNASTTYVGDFLGFGNVF